MSSPSSSSSSSSSSSEVKWRFDVFINFRGEDVRYGFVADLYRCLSHGGINAYIDSEDLRCGDEISPTLMKAIEESRIALLVFSEDYASSRWCLDELVKVMECRSLKGQRVLPAFYKVKPGDIRGLRERYGDALARHEEKLGKDSERVKKWRQALIEAADLSGWPYVDGQSQDETEFIEKIVKEISNIVARAPLSVAKYPVGVGCRVEKVMSLLNMGSDDTRIIGIWGIGGVGKTTIANDVYNRIYRQFDGCSFLANVRETSDRLGLVHLQEKLLREILWKESITVLNVYGGANLIRDRLCCKKILLVLDDVDHGKQLNALAGGCEWFGKGSRIIVTTRDKHVLTSHGIDRVYEVRPLDQDEAFKLLSSYAFPGNQTNDMSRHRIYNILDYAKGLPLAIVVLGPFLCGRSRGEWESTLEKLAENPNKEINSVLKISFDTLEDNEKDIFLDIACFFKGRKRDYVTRVLDGCGLKTLIGIQALIERSLVTIGDGGIVQMHDLIQLMGQDSVKQESPNYPGRRSRLWCYDDVYEVLSAATGTNDVKGIVLQLWRPAELHISRGAFTHMRRLKLLILSNARISGGPECLPDDLRWLEWHRCHSATLEFSASPKKLVCFDVSGSQIKKFRGYLKVGGCESLHKIPDVNLNACDESVGKGMIVAHVLPLEDFEKLKFINFSKCRSMVCTLDLSYIPNLEELNFSNCQQLQEISKIPGKLRRLEANNCKSLTRIPSNICGVGDVELYSSRELLCNRFHVNDLFMPEKFHCPPNHRVVLPGGEMPKWLLPNKEGYISFVASKDLYEKILGVVFCVVFQVLHRSRESTEFEVIGSVNCKAAIHSRRFKFFDLDNVWMEYMELKDLWTVDHFGPNDRTHFHICIRVCNYHELLVKKCGFLLICKPLENDLEVLLHDNQLLDPALFYEVSHEDKPVSTKEKGLNMVNSSIERHRYSSLWSKYGIVSPGREMPKGFVRVEDGSISFKASQDLYNKFVGFFLCVVFDVEDGEKEVSFNIVPCVNGQRRNEVSGTLGSFDTDHMWFQFFRTNALWGLLEGVVDFSQFDESYPIFSLNIRVAGATIKKLGYVLQSNPLEDALKAEIEKNCLMDPASLFENRNDPQYAWRRWRMEGLSLLEDREDPLYYMESGWKDLSLFEDRDDPLYYEESEWEDLSHLEDKEDPLYYEESGWEDLSLLEDGEDPLYYESGWKDWCKRLEDTHGGRDSKY